MIGYNSREIFQDATYDVQTQQLSSPERSIETHVYRNGKIVSTVRSDIPPGAPFDSLEERMCNQHEEVCGKVREGTYELVFLRISRGIIAFESQDYAQALECFETVLTIDETHAEANAYLDKLRSCLTRDAPGRRRVLEEYRNQIESLESSNRILEAGRKRAMLARMFEAPHSPNPKHAEMRRTTDRDRLKPLAGAEQHLLGLWVSLSRRFGEDLLPAIRKRLPRSAGREWIPAIRRALVPALRDTVLPKIRDGVLPVFRDTLLPMVREKLFSKYLLVTLSTVLLMILSGLIAADFQVRLDPAYHTSLGKEYLEANRIAQARNLFYGILGQNPASEEALEGFWETFHRERDYPRAIEMLGTLVEDRQSDPQIRFYLAEACRLSSRCEEAIPHYERAMQSGFSEVPCKIGLGLCLLEQQGLEAAIDLWEGLLQRGTDDYRLDYCLGKSYQASGRLGRASVHYSRALQKRPDSAPIYRALGDCLQGMHQLARAEELREKAASLESSVGVTAAPCPAADPQTGEGPAEPLSGKCFPFPLI
jgi:tetratricopeptide (TPR) repeat protein